VTSGLEGGIDWGLVRIGARFGGATEPLLFRFYHYRLIGEPAVHATVVSLEVYG
jgi:hypothetical protein